MLFVIRLRAKLNSLQEASGGKKLSINDLVIKVYIFLTIIIFYSYPSPKEIM